MKQSFILKSVPPPPPRPSQGFWRRLFGQFRFPSRQQSPVEAASDAHRAQRLFAMNYGKSWKR